MILLMLYVSIRCRYRISIKNFILYCLNSQRFEMKQSPIQYSVVTIKNPDYL